LYANYFFGVSCLGANCSHLTRRTGALETPTVPLPDTSFLRFRQTIEVPACFRLPQLEGARVTMEMDIERYYQCVTLSAGIDGFGHIASTGDFDLMAVPLVVVGALIMPRNQPHYANSNLRFFPSSWTTYLTGWLRRITLRNISCVGQFPGSGPSTWFCSAW